MTYLNTSALYMLPWSDAFCQTTPLVLSVAWQQNLQTIDGKVQPLLPYHQHPPVNVVGQHNKIGSITFEVPFI
jgi:hypothetical protein